MMNDSDLPKMEELRARSSLVDIIGKFITLKKAGKNYIGLCPFHEDKSPSFAIYVGNDGLEKWKCPVCNYKGDGADFIARHQGLSPEEGLKEFRKIVGGAALSLVRSPVKNRKREKPPEEWIHTSGPADTPPPSGMWLDGREVPFTRAWAYRDTDGGLVAWICRLDKPDGKKEIRQYSWMVNTQTGETLLRAKAPADPRPLYGAELLKDNPGTFVLLVEGEKTADAGRRLLGKSVLVMCWPGGCTGASKADLAILKGRNVVLWPDCDSVALPGGEFKPYHEQPGMAAMLEAAGVLESLQIDCRIVRVPFPGGEWAHGHDLADLEAEGWDKGQVITYIKENTRLSKEILPVRAALPDDLPEHMREEVPDYDGPVYDSGEEEHEVEIDEVDLEQIKEMKASAPKTPADSGSGPVSRRIPGYPFLILGWDRLRYYYLPDGAPQVLSFSPREHTKLNLMHLADLEFWAREHGQEKKSGEIINWDEATGVIMEHAKRVGIWDPEIVRGAGAWWDKDRWAVHLGNRIILGSEASEEVEELSLTEIKSDFVYEAGRKINLHIHNKLTNAESFKLARLCEQMRWKKPINGKLLAGFIFLGPICGALEWRPHIWLSGGAGAGKSTIMEMIVSKCLKGPALSVLGGSTEPGIRRELGTDARPIVFDEFESENRRAADRVDAVLQMVTRSSSDTQSKVVQAGGDGKSVSFSSRAMFIFASINVTLKNEASRSRVSVLELVSSDKDQAELKANFGKLKEEIANTFTPEYVQRLHARAIRMIPVIRKNAETFGIAAAAVLDSSRAGDQAGTLLAGAYGLYKETVIGLEEAKAWVAAQDWSEAKQIKGQSDEQLLLKHFMGNPVRAETNMGGVADRTLGDLVLIASGGMTEESYIDKKTAHRQIRRMGFNIGKNDKGKKQLRVAHEHREVLKMLKDTPWEGQYARMIGRIPGAATVTNTRKFGAGPGYYCTDIPLDAVLGKAGEEDED